MSLQRGDRPLIPDPASCRGGTFAGMPQYLDLMQRCWATDPSDRPPVKDVLCSLRELLENSLYCAGRPEPWTPATSSAFVSCEVNGAQHPSAARPLSKGSHKPESGPPCKLACEQSAKETFVQCENFKWESASVSCGSAEAACRAALGQCEQAVAQCKEVAKECDLARQACAGFVHQKQSADDDILKSIHRLLSESKRSGFPSSQSTPGYHKLGTLSRSVGAENPPHVSAPHSFYWDGSPKFMDAYAIGESSLPDTGCARQI